MNCATGSNIIIGAREGQIYRITPRENNDVNQNWLPDSHRLNYKYIHRPDRLINPQIILKDKLTDTTWPEAISTAATQLKALEGKEIAIIASGRMTNEELFLASRLADSLKVAEIDILPRAGEADGLLISADRNPNTAGAKLLKVASESFGNRLPAIVEGIKSGTLKGLILLGENAVAAGIAEADLAKLATLVVVDILPNASTKHAKVVLPAASYAEKRGSMINGKNRLQRLNQAISSPGEAHDDWEILRDLIQAINGSNGIYTIEEVFAQMAATVPEFAGRSLSKIGDLGVQL